MARSSLFDATSIVFAPRGGPTEAGPRRLGLRIVSAAMETILLAMAVTAPWAYGAVETNGQFVLYLGLSALLLLWAARIVLQGYVTVRRCPVSMGLALLMMLGLCQLLPLPRATIRAISPNTAALYDRLLPTQHEQLTASDPAVDATSPSGSTLSLYPFATRTECLRLLAVVALFLIVRSNWTSTRAWRRLAWAVVVNGALLSLFGLVQQFTSDPGTIYWTAHTDSGKVFGPFVCRDHFAFYINISIGFGLGMLLASPGKNRGEGWSMHRLLQSPEAMWLAVLIAFMIVAELMSLSRGGLVGLASGGLTCLLMPVVCRRGLGRLWPLALSSIVVVTLLCWFGFGALPSQMRTLWNGQALQGQRLPIWKNALPILQRFPLFGTGYGTYRYVELLYTHSPADVRTPSIHAHNEYLEALAEGGPLRLAVVLATIILILQQGYRAFARGVESNAGLALGGLFAFSSLVIHSVGDFALRIPAIAVLAVLVVAELCFLDDRGAAELYAGSGNRRRAQGDTVHSPGRSNGFALVLGPVLLVAVAVVIMMRNWQAVKADTLWQRAETAISSTSGQTIARQIDLLHAASHMQPDDAELQLSLARAYLAAFRSASANVLRPTRAAEVILTSVDSWPPAWPVLLAVEAQRVKERAMSQRASPAWRCPDLAAALLRPALRHFAMARDCCPVLPEPHWRLGEYARDLFRGDTRSQYLDRAEEVRPADPDLLHKCALIDFRAGDQARAYKAWQRCLALSPDHLEDVLSTADRLSAHELLTKVLPDRPDVLLAAAMAPPIANDRKARAEVLKRAVALLERRTGAFRAEEWRRAAVIYRALDQTNGGIAAMRAALKQDPRRIDWRMELAQWLYEADRLPEARREAVFILALSPENAQARSLLQTVTRDMLPSPSRD